MLSNASMIGMNFELRGFHHIFSSFFATARCLRSVYQSVKRLRLARNFTMKSFFCSPDIPQ